MQARDPSRCAVPSTLLGGMNPGIVTTALAASARQEIGDFLSALLTVYVLCLIGYIVTNLVFAMGVRMPYNRYASAVLGFLRDVAEPYLRIFRPLPLRIGPLDLTPIVAIFALQIVGGLIVGIIRG
jgi:YggT family protein